MSTGMLVNAPQPQNLFYSIVGKIPDMFDVVKDTISDPIVRGMIILLVVCIFIFSLE